MTLSNTEIQNINIEKLFVKVNTAQKDARSQAASRFNVGDSVYFAGSAERELIETFLKVNSTETFAERELIETFLKVNSTETFLKVNSKNIKSKSGNGDVTATLVNAT